MSKKIAKFNSINIDKIDTNIELKRPSYEGDDVDSWTPCKEGYEVHVSRNDGEPMALDEAKSVLAAVIINLKPVDPPMCPIEASKLHSDIRYIILRQLGVEFNDTYVDSDGHPTEEKHPIYYDRYDQGGNIEGTDDGKDFKSAKEALSHAWMHLAEYLDDFELVYKECLEKAGIKWEDREDDSFSQQAFDIHEKEAIPSAKKIFAKLTLAEQVSLVLKSEIYLPVLN